MRNLGGRHRHHKVHKSENDVKTKKEFSICSVFGGIHIKRQIRKRIAPFHRVWLFKVVTAHRYSVDKIQIFFFGKSIHLTKNETNLNLIFQSIASECEWFQIKIKARTKIKCRKKSMFWVLHPKFVSFRSLLLSVNFILLYLIIFSFGCNLDYQPAKWIN